ncbi:GNAT family protein [uncultured Ferrovibrio sp.]|jgi:ribosomal-protein-alanine N-acetyltransferase|uniref:GNAT family N-acetyltransferase n=1 Tax=uncultured Ferrovibrio sp. TaxID=1576913 RepID=UPI00262DD23C|nr:GNAT family protein [uncultured Ferrovibrio sp.]
MNAIDLFPTLKTTRLLLRPFRAEDEAAFQDFAVKEDFWRFLPGPELDAELVHRFIEARLRDAEAPSGRDWVFAVEQREMQRAIGMVRLSIASTEHRQGNIGFSLDGRLRRQGYASEAVQAALRYGFATLGLHRITALADVENDRSHMVLTKLGFRREGRLKQNFFVRGQWRDCDLFALLRSEWPSEQEPETAIA